jgi:hypothetical protein
LRTALFVVFARGRRGCGSRRRANLGAPFGGRRDRRRRCGHRWRRRTWRGLTLNGRAHAALVVRSAAALSCVSLRAIRSAGFTALRLARRSRLCLSRRTRGGRRRGCARLLLHRLRFLRSDRRGGKGGENGREQESRRARVHLGLLCPVEQHPCQRRHRKLSLVSPVFAPHSHRFLSPPQDWLCSLFKAY